MKRFILPLLVIPFFLLLSVETKAYGTLEYLAPSACSEEDSVAVGQFMQSFLKLVRGRISAPSSTCSGRIFSLGISNFETCRDRSADIEVLKNRYQERIDKWVAASSDNNCPYLKNELESYYSTVIDRADNISPALILKLVFPIETHGTNEAIFKKLCEKPLREICSQEPNLEYMRLICKAKRQWNDFSYWQEKCDDPAIREKSNPLRPKLFDWLNKEIARYLSDRANSDNPMAEQEVKQTLARLESQNERLSTYQSSAMLPVDYLLADYERDVDDVVCLVENISKNIQAEYDQHHLEIVAGQLPFLRHQINRLNVNESLKRRLLQRLEEQDLFEFKYQTGTEIDASVGGANGKIQLITQNLTMEGYAHPSTRSMVNGVMAHEFGHVLQFLIDQTLDPEKDQEEIERFGQMGNCYAAERIYYNLSSSEGMAGPDTNFYEDYWGQVKDGFCQTLAIGSAEFGADDYLTDYINAIPTSQQEVLDNLRFFCADNLSQNTYIELNHVRGTRRLERMTKYIPALRDPRLEGRPTNSRCWQKLFSR